MAKECNNYLATNYFPARPRGEIINGFRNENLEQQTFADESFDLVTSLDVMEHVNEPAACFREISRTLRPGGGYLFTTPTYKEHVASQRAARFLPDGSIEHYREPEYHGNPVSEEGALLTFRYGYDLPELIHSWAGLDTRVYRFHDHKHGLIGEFTEVYLCTKQSGPP